MFSCILPANHVYTRLRHAKWSVKSLAGGVWCLLRSRSRRTNTTTAFAIAGRKGLFKAQVWSPELRSRADVCGKRSTAKFTQSIDPVGIQLTKAGAHFVVDAMIPDLRRISTMADAASKYVPLADIRGILGGHGPELGGRIVY